MKGNYNDSDRSDKLEVLIKTARSLGLYTQTQFLEYIGKNFRLLLGISNIYTDKEAGEIFLAENICVHLRTPKDKFNTLALMIDKLYCLVNGEIGPENLDSLAVHEVLLPGHLYLMILREKLEDHLSFLRSKIIKDIMASTSGKAGNANANKVIELDYLKKNLENNMIGKAIEYFLSTGNLKSRTGLDLMQDKGFCVIADKLNNMRFLSHFRSIHRGAYFAEMKTTTVRKLLPESWGFLCPVHTPDGGPCGLLNHITIACCPLTHEPYNPLTHENLHDLCVRFGMLSLDNYNYLNDNDCYPVMIDGRHAGYVENKLAEEFLRALKGYKVEGVSIPKETEVAILRKGHFKNTVYPMIFITTAPARFLRPVLYHPLNKTEWLSPFEQISTDIDLP
jgi:DNA-directed RNA polymerase I subunit RPA2